MCGRLNIIDQPLSRDVSDALGIPFSASTNNNLSPTQQIEVVAGGDPGLRQVSTSWGIQPSWAKRLLINAQAETVAQKPTFRESFNERRCVVPCSGWYEWRAEGGSRKTRYLFSHVDEAPLYMAALWYPALSEQELPRIVTLTTTPDSFCAPYHHRMPQLVMPSCIDLWLNADAAEVVSLLGPVDDGLVCVSGAAE